MHLISFKGKGLKWTKGHFSFYIFFYKQNVKYINTTLTYLAVYRNINIYIFTNKPSPKKEKLYLAFYFNKSKEMNRYEKSEIPLSSKIFYD